MRMNIIKGKPFQADFVVKANGSTTALVLDPKDTGTITFFTIGNNPETTLEKNLLLTNTEMGTFTLYLTSEETALFDTRIGFGEDSFPVIPTYKAALEFKTLSQGHMSALIDQVYIVDMGL